MRHSLLVTGASGALGPHLLAELLASNDIERVFVLLRPGQMSAAERLQTLRAAVSGLAAGGPVCTPVSLDRLVPLAGDIRRPELGLEHAALRDVTSEVSVIVHAAAHTGFAAPWADLHAVNVAGTANVLALGERCRRLQQLLFVSTVCVAGMRTGAIPEALDSAAPVFVNPYERSKWEAEHLVARSSLPVQIARVSTCMGAGRTGYVHRLGALHHALHWMVRGLVPMIPGRPDAQVDLIATDVAAGWIARAALTAVVPGGVYHVAAGRRAPTLGELLTCVADHLEAMGTHAGGHRLERPLLVEPETFALFRRSLERTGDRLFDQVLRSTDAFLPGLLYPKVYDTRAAEAVWGGAAAAFGLAHDGAAGDRHGRRAPAARRPQPGGWTCDLPHVRRSRPR